VATHRPRKIELCTLTGSTLNEEHLRRLLREFLDYYHNDRTHLSLGKDPPFERAVCPPSSTTARVTSLPRVGGRHHRYEWREAA
jgi:hypothetical protein